MTKPTNSELCSSGFSLEEISKIKEFCSENSFSYSPCLTSNTLVLISNDPNSVKTTAAIENRIKIVTKGYLKSRSTKKSRLNDLLGLQVTTTGITTHFDKVVERIDVLGGNYHSSLVRETDLLIVKDLKHFSKKVEMAKKWGVQIKDLEWLMSESVYEDWDRKVKEGALQSANATKCEGLAVVLQSETIDFMDGVYIYLGKGFDDPALKSALSQMVRMYGGVVLDEESDIVTHHIVGSSDEVGKISYKWLKDCVKEKSVLPVEDYLIKAPEKAVAPAPQLFKPKVHTQTQSPTIFSSLKFTISGFSPQETQIIKSTIVSHGGTFTNAYTHHIRPFHIPYSESTILLTEFYIEACIRASKMVAVDRVLYRPTGYPIAKVFDQVVTTTGLDEYERDWVERVVQILGGRCTREMSRKNTVLVSKTETGMKMVKAKEWGIKVMKMEEVERLLGVDLGEVVEGYTSKNAEKENLKGGKEKKSVEEERSEGDGELLKVIMRDSSISPPPLAKRVKLQDEMEVQSVVSSGVGYKDHLAEKVQMQIFEDLHVREKKFMFSGLAMELRDSLTETINNLGGTVLENDTWSDECTHLIITKIAKTEKFLAACASCCWILKPEFVTDSAAARKWVAETEYVPTGNDFTDAAQYWKLNYSITNRKPFQDWKVVLDLDRNRQQGFKRLLAAGGATVLSSMEEVDRDTDVYYLCDGETLTPEQANVKTLQSTKVIEWMLSSGKVPLD